MTVRVDDPVGLAELAERLGVQRNTAEMWRKRRLLPEPTVVVSGTPVWSWRAIERWARATRRGRAGEGQEGATDPEARSPGRPAPTGQDRPGGDARRQAQAGPGASGLRSPTW
jgi:hypothetical protein